MEMIVSLAELDMLHQRLRLMRRRTRWLKRLALTLALVEIVALAALLYLRQTERWGGLF